LDTFDILKIVGKIRGFIMTKKIAILLLGLVLGSNVYSANKLSTMEVVSGAIAKYCLYFSALGYGLTSLGKIGKAFDIVDTANKLNLIFLV
jgi:uncharacterized membrane protein (UPF0136 family)